MRTAETPFRWAEVTDYVAVGAASAQSAVFGANTFVIRIASTTACHINVGTNPTAAATDNNGFYLPANVIEYLRVTPGQRLAVIQDAAAGSLSVASMTR